MKSAALAGLATTAAVLLTSGAAQADFPAYGADTGPAYIITLTDPCSPSDDCTTTLSVTDQPSYSGAGDAYIGVVNSSAATITFLMISGQNLFKFDGKGIDAFGAPGNAMDATGYGGPDAYFGIDLIGPNGSQMFQVLFDTPLNPGQATYFSLAGAPTQANNGVPEPATWAMLIVGMGAVGGVLRHGRRRIARAI